MKKKLNYFQNRKYIQTSGRKTSFHQQSYNRNRKFEYYGFFHDLR